jgi:dipeptidyl aminopeptidase/acylaminoacyl peptidase
MKSGIRQIKATGIALAFLIPASAWTQGALEDYKRAERFLPWNTRDVLALAEVNPHWIEKGHRFWYRKIGRGGKEFVLVDPDRNTQGPAFDYARLAAALSRASHREYPSNRLPFDSFDFVREGKALQLEIEGARWKCSLATYECTRDNERQKNPLETLSPDGRWAAFVRGYNLYVRDLSTGEVVQLTRDGEKGYDYATPLPSLRLMVEHGTEDVQERTAVFWCPDSSKLVTYRLDSRNAGHFTSLQFVPPDQLRPKAYTYTYPLPGEVVPKAQPIIFDVNSGKRTDVDTPPLGVYYYGGPHQITWFKDSKRFYYQFIERGYKATELREVDAETGKQRVMVRETAEPRVDAWGAFRGVVGEGGEVLWPSERDGWNHIYLYDGRTGQLENPVTKGPWVVRGIAHVDEKSRQVYFIAAGREPNEDLYQTHLYKANFDGGGLTLMTPENADHEVTVSSDGAYFVDNYSRPDLPGESVLRHTSDGSVVRELENTDVSALLKIGWKFPEPFRGKAADGQTDIDGLIWRPAHFSPSKKYPVVEHIYSGPHSFFVPKTFAGAITGHRLAGGVPDGDELAVAQLGFIVVAVDGRGSASRSLAFHLFSYRNLGGLFDDHVALIKQMGARYPYMDLSRVGIWGTSAGGYGAAHAILVHPEFYKVCVSISADHDPRLDKAVWNEMYQGYPVQADYVEQSNATLASRLEGHLLLVHGDVDDNVNPVETIRFADALMKANKNFDMLIVPNMFHGEAGNPYLIRRRWDYFVRYLLGVVPPEGFEIKKAEHEPTD